MAPAAPVAGGAAEGDDPDEPEASQGDAEDDPPRAPTVSERVAAILQTRGGLQARANDLTARASQLEAQVQALTNERDQAVQRAETAEARVSEYEAQLSRLEAEATTVAQGVTDEIAQMGIPERNLPEESSQGEEPGETLEQLYAQLERTDDPLAAGLIAQKINKLESE